MVSTDTSLKRRKDFGSFTMKLVNIHYTGFGGLAGVVNGLVTAPGAEAHEWVMGYYGVAALDSSHRAFCEEHQFPYATFRPKPKQPWSALWNLARWLIRERPDVIICHSITTIPACAWAAWRCNIPLLAVEHTPNEVKSRSEWVSSRLGMMLADRVIVLTETYERLLEAGLGGAFRPKKLRRIPNGVDAVRFHPRGEYTCNVAGLRAGMAARLAHSKRHDLLIDVAACSGVNIEFAGAGECMSALEARALSRQGASVKFRGLVPTNDMPSWMRELDIYLHASDGETLSMSILQAMASGLPIIASEISGMDEILGQEGVCGLLVPNTVEAWLDAIKLLSADPALRARMGRAARERALASFSTEAMLNRYLKVIDELI